MIRRRRREGARPDALRTVSLRRRVTVSVIAVLGVVLVALLFLVDEVFAAQSSRDAQAVLNDRVRTAQQVARQNITPEQFVLRLRGRGVQVQVVTPTGEVFGSLPEKNAGTPPLTRQFVVTTGRQLVGDTVTLAADTTVISDAQVRLRRVLIATGIGALVVTAAVLVFTVRMALAPLDAMTSLARSIAGGHRGRRLSPSRTDTELGRTAAAFDDMLDALEGTERQARAAEAQARSAEAQARAAEAQSRGSEARTRQFVADAAHELRTPIAGLQAVADAVLQSGPDADPDERDRMVLLLVREAQRAGRLVDDLLALAKIDAGLELQHERVDLFTLANNEAERTKLLAPGMTIEVAGEPVEVVGDPQRLTQVLANLMDNARQATGPDGRIRVTVGRAGSFAEMVVADNGPGVPEADRERIFDRLVRLDQARDRRSGGSGLGLAIALGFVRAHGGDLTCEAPPPGESGAVFRVAIPLPDIPTQPVFRPPAVS
ncbi:sensor histidine kinase [Gandjariella thermophila]|uniref:histidine kinase n=1 Tax=Gandjariella thermophila TaxID=1931992 RepID=A0A4D4JEK8_9PSEU|nr:HAMP domain-containing sensor histidine kinase [Gandjariella thermophila]GDY33098.1 two-component sensor histidine kinase [Gandjariella thermophila]